MSENASLNGYDRVLGVKGLHCPLPILHTKKALPEIASGEKLCVFATDPATLKDFQAFSKRTDNVLLDCVENDAGFTFCFQRK